MPKRNHEAAFVPGRVIKDIYNIHEKTLRVWADNGTLRHVRFQGTEGKRLYHLGHLQELLGDKGAQAPAQTKRRVIYIRVSSAHQRQDLGRQQEDLQKAFPNHEVIADIGSGINFKRKGFVALLDAVLGNLVEEVVVMHRDRLCRFGVDLVESIFKSAGTKLVVHGARDGPPDDARELADDLLAVTTVFVARHNGRCSADNRRRRSEDTRRRTNKACADGSQEVSSLPDARAANDNQNLDGSRPLDLQPGCRLLKQ